MRSMLRIFFLGLICSLLIASSDAAVNMSPGGGLGSFFDASMADSQAPGAWATLRQPLPTASATEGLNGPSASGVKLTAPCTSPPPPPNEWYWEFYNNTTFTGNPVYTSGSLGGFLSFTWGPTNNPSCFPYVDNFSVRFTRTVNFAASGLYRFFLTTPDEYVRLYIDGELKFSRLFGGPPSQELIDVTLTAGNHVIMVEYTEYTGENSCYLHWEAYDGYSCFANVPAGRWKGEYFNNSTLTGNPVMVRDDGDGFLGFDFGIGGSGNSACTIAVDNFSVRWTRTVNFAAGAYRFTTSVDNGVRLYVDGQLKIDQWGNLPPNTYTTDVALSAGNHEIKLEFVEYTGGASISLSWVNLCIANVSADRWRGEYHNNQTLTGTPAMVRDDGAGFLDFNFGAGGPSSTCGLNADNFSARWTRTVNFAAGTYRFTASVDNGVRLYVDGQLKMDQWGELPPNTYTTDVSLSAGNHEIKLEFVEYTGGASISLFWADVNCLASVPADRWRGEYYNNATLTGFPAMVRDDGDSFLNFNFGDGGPGGTCGLGVDNFSARWTRTINFAAGAYRFSVTGDDGVRLYVDGQLKIDAWVNQSPTTYTADVSLSAGNHEVRLEYFESGGPGVAFLSWTGANCMGSVPAGRWKGEYYNNLTLAGDPAMVRDDGDGVLSFNFGNGGPSSSCGLGVDNFSVRWTRMVNFTSGVHRFTVTSDDGARLYVDGQLKIDAWVNQPPTTYTADVSLSAGNHEVRLEYYEFTVTALINLRWTTVLGLNCLPNVLIGNVQRGGGTESIATTKLSGSGQPCGQKKSE